MGWGGRGGGGRVGGGGGGVKSFKCSLRLQEAERGDRFTPKGSLALHPESSKGYVLFGGLKHTIYQKGFVPDRGSCSVLEDLCDGCLILVVSPQSCYVKRVCY